MKYIVRVLMLPIVLILFVAASIVAGGQICWRYMKHGAAKVVNDMVLVTLVLLASCEKPDIESISKVNSPTCEAVSNFRQAGNTITWTGTAPFVVEYYMPTGYRAFTEVINEARIVVNGSERDHFYRIRSQCGGRWVVISFQQFN